VASSCSNKIWDAHKQGNKMVDIRFISAGHGITHLSSISALRRLRQVALEFEASLGYSVRPCLKINKQINKKIIYANITLDLHI
jgi:hypothetical protein